MMAAISFPLRSLPRVTFKCLNLSMIPCSAQPGLTTMCHMNHRCYTVCIYFFWNTASPWTIYSATTFLEKGRKVVLEKWFFKLGFFFQVNLFSRSRFLEPLFYTFLEKRLQNKWSIVNSNYSIQVDLKS